MNVKFFTSIEAARPYVQKLPTEWYNSFRSFPRKGDLIQIPIGNTDTSFELEVQSVVWSFERQVPVVRILLQIPSYYPNHPITYWNDLLRKRIDEKSQRTG